MARAKLLLIEDDVSLSKMYEKKFKLDGFEVIVAFDGLEGLELAIKEKPDLVILDVMLPKLDGLAVFKKMRSTAITFKTPVLMLTNFDQEDAIFECFKLGAVDYLLKSSVTPKQVVEKVDHLLKNN